MLRIYEFINLFSELWKNAPVPPCPILILTKERMLWAQYFIRTGVESQPQQKIVV